MLPTGRWTEKWDAALVSSIAPGTTRVDSLFQKIETLPERRAKRVYITVITSRIMLAGSAEERSGERNLLTS